jgi:hypothetical protein
LGAVEEFFASAACLAFETAAVAITSADVSMIPGNPASVECDR